MNTNEVLKLALESLEGADWYINQLEMIVYSADDAGTQEDRLKVQQAITALREELAKPDFWEGYVPEPVKPEVCCGEYATCLRACTPRGKWLANEALDKKAENAKALGLDYEPAQDSGIVTAGGFDPRTQRPWVGLTDEERKFVRNSVGYNQFVTAGEYAEHVQKATEFRLLEKNR